MISNLLLIYLLILLIAVQGTKSDMTADPASCQGNLLQEVDAAITEMIDMADWAYSRTLGGSTGNLPSKDDQRVVYNTYTSYFKSANPKNTAAITSNLLSMLFSTKMSYISLMSCRNVQFN